MNGQRALPLDATTVGEIEVRRLVFPYLPPSKNVYDHWPVQWKSGAKKKWVREVRRQVDEMQIPRGLDKIGLAARLVFATKTRRDPQNYAQALWNWIPDALVDACVIDDDRTGMIDIGPNWGIDMAHDLRRSIPAKRRQRTIVTVSYRVPVGVR